MTSPNTKTTTGFAARPAHVSALSAEQLAEALRLIQQASGVELKLSVPDTDRRSAVAALGMDPLDAEIRQVAFFDTPDLALNRCGLVVRARRIQRKPGDVVVKLRPVVPDELPPASKQSPAFSVEVDAMPGGFVCSGSMKSDVDAAEMTAVFSGDRPLRKCFTKEQRAFHAAYAPEGIEPGDLVKLGPINVLKLKFRPPGLARRLAAEQWFYPNGSRILELSTKAKPEEALEVAALTKSFLAGKGIDLTAAQQTKTKAALRYFSRELVAAKVER